MASAQDVLDAINNNTTAVGQKLDTLNASVNALDADVKLVQQLLLWGFEQLITLGQYTNQALFQNDNQNDTIICSLQQIAVNTCGIWNEADVQTELQKRTVSAAQKLAQLYAASHGDAAIALHRNAELLRRIEECCPCEPPKPVCDESPCPAPAHLDQQPPATQPPPPLGPIISVVQSSTPRPRANPRATTPGGR
jgi:hypothetical protein